MKMKSSDPEATLRNGSKPSGNGGLAAPGNDQATRTVTKAHSDTETLGNPPSPEAVQDAKCNMGVQTSAREAYIKASGNHK
jgi:hypothetical protein